MDRIEHSFLYLQAWAKIQSSFSSQPYHLFKFRSWRRVLEASRFCYCSLLVYIHILHYPKLNAMYYFVSWFFISWLDDICNYLLVNIETFGYCFASATLIWLNVHLSTWVTSEEFGWIIPCTRTFHLCIDYWDTIK